MSRPQAQIVCFDVDGKTVALRSAAAEFVTHITRIGDAHYCFVFWTTPDYG